MIPIREAAELYESDTMGRKLFEWLGYLSQKNRKIVSGPVDDVPIEFNRFLIIGYKNGELFYWIAALDSSDEDSEDIRKDLLKEIDKLPVPKPRLLEIEAVLLAHRYYGQEILASFQLGTRQSDGVEVGLLCFTPGLTLEQTIYLVRLVAQMSRKKHKKN